MSLDSLATNRSGSSSTGQARRRLPAWLLPVLLVVGFLAILAALFGQRLVPAVPIRTAPVVTLRAEVIDPVASSPSQPETMLFQASGWLEPDPYIVQVPTLVNGTISEVFVLEGETVEEGQLLATLVDDDAKLDVTEAKRQLDTIRARIAAHCSSVPIIMAEKKAAEKKVEAAETKLADLRDHLRRMQSVPKGTLPVRELNEAHLAVERQLAEVESVQADIPRLQARLDQIDFERMAMGFGFSEAEVTYDRAKLALSRHRIVSPMAGVVLHLHAAPGKKRMLNMDAPKSNTIVELYDPEKIQARIDVPLTEAAGLRLDQRVELVSDLLPDLTLKGTVTRITGEADLQRNTLQVKVAISNPDPRFRPEMLVRARFFGGSSSLVGPTQGGGRYQLFAPQEAMINVNGDSATAWVVSPEETAEKRFLTLGRTRKDGHREVLSGLKSGERLILPPHDKLKPGARLNDDLD